ncbi:MAG: RidA family protein [Fuerstiella sp.]|nr:RidA family protein [Fuerstiella sp.]
MASQLKLNVRGGYRFLQGIEPYSSGVITVVDREIIHATLSRPVAWQQGLTGVREYLEQRGLQRFCLCGVELRCPEPHPMSGFFDFNRQYRAMLEEWDMLVEGENPVARTNVAPVVNPPNETQLYGFSFVEPSESSAPTFVVAGGGELPHRELSDQHIVRFGETSEAALLDKARCVVDIMQTRLNRLEANDQPLSSIRVYCAHPVHTALENVIIPGIPNAAQVGIHWFHSRPPIRNIEFEMDLRGVRREIIISELR